MKLTLEAVSNLIRSMKYSNNLVIAERKEEADILDSEIKGALDMLSWCGVEVDVTFKVTNTGTFYKELLINGTTLNI